MTLHPTVLAAAKLLFFNSSGIAKSEWDARWEGLPSQVRASYIADAKAVLRLAWSLEPSEPNVNEGVDAAETVSFGLMRKAFRAMQAAARKEYLDE